MLPTMEQAAIARRDIRAANGEIRVIVQTASLTRHSAIRANLELLLRAARERLRLAQRRLEHAEVTLALLVPARDALRAAEDAYDWDVLGIHAFRSGRKQAGELIPLLDVIRAQTREAGMPESAELARARRALAPWFETWGDRLLRKVVLDEVAPLRAPTLRQEYELWLGAS